MKQLQQLIKADAQVSLFEWCLFKILRVALMPRVNYASTLELEQCTEECRVLLSAVAREGNAMEDGVLAAFEAGMAALQVKGAPTLLAPADNLAALETAVERLRQLKPLQKPRLLKALVQCIRADGEITSGEAELLRAVGANLDCPVPPLP